ncbi:MAG: D-glycero-beta-D-manno-heptose-7-phosphate kinase [Chlorobiales bacterium]|nr:D-glycero-beta-D-manno-heptose-7-phosphate kinase [Chlorobiales bacterium]
MKRNSLEKLFNAFKQQTIAVIGDVMLDKYIFGHVSRISPEAPVPVIDVREESFRLGGAANVAMNIHSLGGNALLFGVCGNDADSEQLLAEMTAQGFSPDSLMQVSGRPTTCKTRVIAHNHHIVRIDSETREPISKETETHLFENLESKIKGLSAIIFEDYNKGVLSTSLIKRVTDLAIRHDVPILVDPKKNFFFDYQNCTVFKPNLKEVSEALGHSFRNTDEDIELACKMLGEKLKTKYMVLTRGEKGISVFNQTLTHLPSVALEVADVSGAGDTVIAVLTLGLTAGLDIVDAARLANFAAGIVCAEVGAVSVNRDKLFTYCMEYF